MTQLELLKVVLKDPMLKQKYNIPETELNRVSFDVQSSYPIIEVLKTIIQQKSESVSDANVYKNIKNLFSVN
jgi:hypothetical protein